MFRGYSRLQAEQEIMCCSPDIPTEVLLIIFQKMQLKKIGKINLKKPVKLVTEIGLFEENSKIVLRILDEHFNRSKDIRYFHGAGGVDVDVDDNILFGESNRLLWIDKNGNLISEVLTQDYFGGVLIDNDSVLGVNRTREIVRYDKNGKKLSNVGKFQNAKRIAVNEFGNYLVSDLGANTYVELDPTGKIIHREKLPELNSIFGICYDFLLRRIIVTSAAQGPHIHIFDLNGNFISKITISQFGSLWGVCTDGDSNIICVDHSTLKVYILDKDGTLCQTLTCNTSPCDVTVDSQGRVIVSTGRSIHIFS